MEINRQAEPLLRDILEAAVKRDGDRFVRTLESLPDEATAREVLHLSVAVSTFVLLSEYEGRPGDGEICRIAASAAGTEQWLGLSASDYEEAITAMLDERPADLEPHALAAAPLTLAAYLLALGAEEGEWWFTYLDRVEAALERR